MIHESLLKKQGFLLKSLYFFIVSLHFFSLPLSADMSVKHQLPFRDLEFVGLIQGKKESPLHQKVFGTINGQNYLKFFYDRVKDIKIRNCPNPTTIACVEQNFPPQDIWISESYFTNNYPQIARAIILFHEARHLEADEGYWPHQICPFSFQGKPFISIWTGLPLGGTLSCDDTTLGAYGTSALLFKNVAQFCENCTDKVKLDAHFYAEDQMNRIINPTALERLRNDLYFTE